MLIGVIAEELLNGLAVSSGGLDPILDVDVFPSPAVRVPGFLLLEGSFNEGDVIYQSYVGDVDNSIFPPPVVDSDTVYIFTKTQIVALSPSLFRDDLSDAFYPPIVLTKVLGPSLVIDDDLFGGTKRITQGKASINRTFPIDKVFDVDIIYRPIVEFSGLVILPGKTVLSAGDPVLISTTTIRAALGGASVNDTAPSAAPPPLGYLLPSLIAADDAFIAPDARRPIAPSIFTDADVFFAPTRLNYAAPSAVLDSDVFFAPFTARQLGPGAVADNDAFIGPAFTQPGLFALFVDPGEFISPPTVTTGRLVADIVVDGDIFRAPFAAYIGTSSVFFDTDVCYAPTIGQPVSLTQVFSSSRAGLGSMAIIEDGSGKTQII